MGRDAKSRVELNPAVELQVVLGDWSPVMGVRSEAVRVVECGMPQFCAGTGRKVLPRKLSDERFSPMMRREARLRRVWFHEGCKSQQ